MNRHVKRAAERILPRRIFATIQSIRSRNYQIQLLREWGLSDATNEMVNQYGVTVLQGPFRGLKYPRSCLLSRAGIPILFGTYELELHPIVEEVISRDFGRIIDIGCAEGYYAVGLARRTKAVVYGFDCEPRERFDLRQMARENGVADRVHSRAWCNTKTLTKLAAGQRSLIISDCEGYEFYLFSDEVTPALRNCDLIIELHEHVFPGLDLRSILLERFRASHASQTIKFDRLNIGSGVPDVWKKFAREARPPHQQWLYLKPLLT
jgi:hypothetical protein